MQERRTDSRPRLDAMRRRLALWLVALLSRRGRRIVTLWWSLWSLRVVVVVVSVKCCCLGFRLIVVVLLARFFRAWPRVIIILLTRFLIAQWSCLSSSSCLSLTSSQVAPPMATLPIIEAPSTRRFIEQAARPGPRHMRFRWCQSCSPLLCVARLILPKYCRQITFAPCCLSSFDCASRASNQSRSIILFLFLSIKLIHYQSAAPFPHHLPSPKSYLILLGARLPKPKSYRG